MSFFGHDGASIVLIVSWAVLLYALACAGLQSLVLLAASLRIPRLLWRETRSGLDEVFAYPGTPGVTVVVPAHNEARGIIQSVRSLVSLRYPDLEIIVVDDGSTDDTAKLLSAEFGLEPVERTPTRNIQVLGEIHEIYSEPGGGLVTLIRKATTGRKADALNAGLNYTTREMVCMIDGDSVLEPDALLMAVRPMLEDPHVMAVGGVIRPANGVRIDRGHVLSVQAPHSLLARIQVVEYLRAFLMARVAWTGINGVLIVAGAFGLFRTAVVEEMGGMATESLAEDAELVADLHRRLRRRKEKCKVVILPHPICWSEVPERMRDLGKQRRRWSRGLAQVLGKHMGALFRPRYGTFGFIILPYFILFELLAPVIEILGWIVVPAGYFTGVLSPEFTVAFVLASIGFGITLSLTTLIAEEVAFHQCAKWSDFLKLIEAAVVENLGVRQLICWHRARGLFDALIGRHAKWGHHERVGLARHHQAAYVDA